jgi:aryl-alcohol dehydrogenase-like predicted oxidoreductase
MDYTTLGRTGLKVSVMGLGCGGPSRAGQSTGRTEGESVDIVKRSLDAGVNFIDTAEGYKTESIVGRGIKGHDRSSLVISTKAGTWDEMTGEDLRVRLEGSLAKLGTDYVDVYHLHGVPANRYGHLARNVVPTMQKLRDEGKIRFLGVTEVFGGDNRHVMLQQALRDDLFDVVMVGFNMLNQTARKVVFPQTIERNVGVLIMFAVRRALSNPDKLREVVGKLVQEGKVDGSGIDAKDAFGFMVHEGGALSVTDAAYRYCRYEPGVHVVLSGTGNPEHLARNVESLQRGPLPREDVDRVNRLFASVDNVTGG